MARIIHLHAGMRRAGANPPPGMPEPERSANAIPVILSFAIVCWLGLIALVITLANGRVTLKTALVVIFLWIFGLLVTIAVQEWRARGAK
jgi:hypothetical protein